MVTEGRKKGTGDRGFNNLKGQLRLGRQALLLSKRGSREESLIKKSQRESVESPSPP